MTPTLAARCGLLALAAVLPATARAQDKTAPAAAPAAQGKLAEWPAIKDTDKDHVLALEGQFHKPDAKIQEDAKNQLIAIGDGAMPLLMQRVSDRAENVNPQLFAVFDVLLEKKHAALMAREIKKERIELRRYLTRRLCRFGDPDMRPVFESLLKDKDEETVFCAQLGLLALKQRTALAPVLAYVKVHWNAVAPLVADVLTPARSRELGDAVFESIANAQAVDQMNGLRLARYLMVKDHSVILRRYLEAGEHTVKREAVNAARVLNGEPPIENLNVFQAIEQAKQWLQKL
jgi:hypothetical protein